MWRAADAATDGIVRNEPSHPLEEVRPLSLAHRQYVGQALGDLLGGPPGIGFEFAGRFFRTADLLRQFVLDQVQGLPPLLDPLAE